MKKIALILREPFIDRIPSLKTLIYYLAEHGHHITVITSISKQFPLISFHHKNIKIKTINERTHKFGIPTFIKLFIKSLLCAISNSNDIYIGGDLQGNFIAHHISRFFRKIHFYFVLEFPQIVTKKHQKLSIWDKREKRGLECADFIITHDKWHKSFLLKNFSIDPSRILCLPNSSLTPPFSSHSNYLREELHLSPRDLIILHSGGFGKWFRCMELALCTKNWPLSAKLVFHVSHDISNTQYYLDCFSTYDKSRIVFTSKPVDTFTLDRLVASADIGIALYSEDLLEYRATFMGLASGKISNYLKCGVPVIATNLESLTFIEEYKCGILINDEIEIAQAISEIALHHRIYSENAKRCYLELWHPQNYLTNIIRYI